MLLTRPGRPVVVAHRGASGYRPEHSRAAYELALRLGADAVEPDIVATRDGVLVLRHENEISGTTDVSEREEFRARRTTREVDGVLRTGWFTEDFTWAELSTLRVRERLPRLRTGSARYDRHEGILRLSDLLALLDAAAESAGQRTGLVAEIKHGTHFAAAGLPLDELVAADLRAAGWDIDAPLVVESFEKTVLARLRERGVGASYIYLVEARGAAADERARHGSAAPAYADELQAHALLRFAGASGPERLDGVSVEASLLRDADGCGDPALVQRAHAAGLAIWAWTLRPENRFLPPAFRRGLRPERFGDWEGAFREVLATGVDGVFTDHPDLVLGLVAGSSASPG